MHDEIAMGYTERKLSDSAYLIQGDKNESMYLINGKNRSLLIDAGMEEESLKRFCERLTDKETICVLTHGHFDHIGKCGEFSEVYLDRRDLDMYLKNSNGSMGPVENFVCKDVDEVKKMEDFYDLGDRKIETIPLPGHTLGSVIFLDPHDKAVYCGDAIGSGCGVLMVEGIGSLSLQEYREGLAGAIERLEKAGVDESWSFYGGHDGQQYHSRTCSYNPLSLKLMKDMKILCEKMIDNTATIHESIRDGQFGRVKEIIGIEGNAELQLIIEE